jgi:hypothetical protein
VLAKQQRSVEDRSPDTRSLRIDLFATAIFHRMAVKGLSDLDLSYTPPFSAP